MARSDNRHRVRRAHQIPDGRQNGAIALRQAGPVGRPPDGTTPGRRASGGGTTPPGQRLERLPSSLTSRWALGATTAGVCCTGLALLRGLSAFPDWTVGAGVGLLCCVLGVSLGTVVLRRASSSRMRSPEGLVSVIGGVLFGLVSLSVVTLSTVDYSQLRSYTQCMNSANTISAQDSCQTRFMSDLGTY